MLKVRYMITKKQYIEKYNNLYKEQQLSKFDEYIRNKPLIEIFKKPEKVLDLAGGDGSVSEWLMKSVGCDVTLVDISEVALEKAKSRGIKKVFCGNIDEEPLPFEDATFDNVFWGDNIEHLYNPMFTLQEIKRVLRGGGRVIISFPNMGYWYYRYYYLKYGEIIRTEGTLNEPWEWEHIRFFNLKIIRKMLTRTGFCVSKVYGVNDPKFKIQCQLMKFLPSIFASILIVVAEKK
jgi:methionine biosynthesis protein MetW